jgi:propanol-preferring alcohol dehydrogenase
MANGVCRSDWHIWKGDIVRTFPAIMGHEMSAVVEEVTAGVSLFKKGDRVVVPFPGSDGTCRHCQRGLSHLCINPMMPSKACTGGFTQYVVVPLADLNLVHLPDNVSFAEGAALGCRFMTSFHALSDRAQIRSGEWVAIYGCGGVELSAINIAAAMGCQAIGVDVNVKNLDLASKLGAGHVIYGREVNPVEAVLEITQGGAHVAVDALGITETCVNSIRPLQKRGCHIQIGLTTREEAGYISLPINDVVRGELSILGSVGMPSHQCAEMIPIVANGSLNPKMLITEEISLHEVEDVFARMTGST